MQIPSEYINYAIGGLAAMAITKYLGWLHLPFLNQPAPPRPTVAADPSAPQASYSTVMAIPHRITITPEKQQ